MSYGNKEHVVVQVDQGLKAEVETLTSSLAQNTTQLDDVTINIRKFGAKSDGVTDDTVAINNAIVDVFNSGGGTVLIPNNTMVKSVILLKPGVKLKGKTNNKNIPKPSLLLDGVSRQYGIMASENYTNSTGLENLTIRNFSCTYAIGVVGNTDFFYCENVTINCKTGDGSVNTLSGIYSSKSYWSTFKNVQIYYAVDGIKIDNDSSSMATQSGLIDNCILSLCDNGVIITTYTNSFNVNNSAFEANRVSDLSILGVKCSSVGCRFDGVTKIYVAGNNNYVDLTQIYIARDINPLDIVINTGINNKIISSYPMINTFGSENIHNELATTSDTVYQAVFNENSNTTVIDLISNKPHSLDASATVERVTRQGMRGIKCSTKVPYLTIDVLSSNPFVAGQSWTIDWKFYLQSYPTVTTQFASVWNVSGFIINMLPSGSPNLVLYKPATNVSTTSVKFQKGFNIMTLVYDYPTDTIMLYINGLVCIQKSGVSTLLTMPSWAKICFNGDTSSTVVLPDLEHYETRISNTAKQPLKSYEYSGAYKQTIKEFEKILPVNIIQPAIGSLKLPQTAQTTEGYIWYDPVTHTLKYRDNTGIKTVTAT
jgi:hypothetical protein